MATSTTSAEIVQKESGILCRFNKLPTFNGATLLFVSSKGIGTKNLINTMLGMVTTYAIQIRTTYTLPLVEEKPDKPRPRIDYIVFVVDLSKEKSFRTVCEAVKHMDIDYFVGRCCFVLSKAKQEHLHCCDVNEVITLVESYNSSMICGDLENPKEISNMVDKILYNVEIACGFCKVDALQVDATQLTAFMTERIDNVS